MRYITANRIFSGLSFLPAGSVLVVSDKGIVENIVALEKVDPLVVEHHEGILCPGFINTHCHLELSHLKNKIPRLTGIVDFGLAVIRHRNEASPEDQGYAMKLADTEMQEEGIVAVGDISNTTSSISAKRNSNLYYHTFVELIGLNPDRSASVFEKGSEIFSEFKQAGLKVSLAAHAPYSASLPLIELVMQHCGNLNAPTSLHNQESEAENQFFISKTGDYVRMYDRLQLSIDHFKTTGKTSLQSVIPKFNSLVKTLLVHNTFTSQNDLEFAMRNHRNLYFGMCPNANLYIENNHPDVLMINSANGVLTLGTDSLASNDRLSIVHEINTILKKLPGIPVEMLLKAATFNGAQFLGIEDQFGSFKIGLAGGINLIEGKPGEFSVKKLA